MTMTPYELEEATLRDRPAIALLVIDVQNGVVAGTPRHDEVVSNIAALVNRARGAEVPVVWVAHHDDGLPRGSTAWEYVPELVRDPGEPLIEKRYGDAFEDTELERTLGERGVGRPIVAGAQTGVCIRAALHGAIARGYDATLVSDAHTTEDLTVHGAPPPEQVIAHTNLYWSHHTAPGRTAGTVAAADVDFATGDAEVAAEPGTA